MENNRLYTPETDFRQVSFNMELDNQNFELAILSLYYNNDTLFYVIFKPVDYNHIIHLTPITSSWRVVCHDFKKVFDEVCSYYNINENIYPNIVDFFEQRNISGS